MNVQTSSTPEKVGGMQDHTDEEIVLGDLAGLLARRWVLIAAVMTIVVLLGGIYLWRTTPVYEARALILTPNRGAGGGLQFDSLIIGSLIGGGGNSLQTEAEVVKSPAVAGEALRSLPPDQRSSIPEDVTECLDARQYKNTNIIEVVASGWTADATAAFANAVAERYLQYQEDQSKKQTRSVLNYLESKIGEVEADLLNAQAALRDFKESNGTVDLQAEAAAVVQRAANIETEVQKAEAALAAARAQLEAAGDAAIDVDGRPVRRQEIAESPEVTELKSRLVELESKRAELLQEYTASSPEVQSIERQLQEVRGQLDEAATRAVAGVLAPLQAQVWASEAQVDALQAAAGVVR
ncbi:MAG: hypothetical protein J7M38_15785, partial [Armatimonadetes bacterium]|nr:hypothetical protein [Armatimonadota bacterium]